MPQRPRKELVLGLYLQASLNLWWGKAPASRVHLRPAGSFENWMENKMLSHLHGDMLLKSHASALQSAGGPAAWHLGIARQDGGKADLGLVTGGVGCLRHGLTSAITPGRSFSKTRELLLLSWKWNKLIMTKIVTSFTPHYLLQFFSIKSFLAYQHSGVFY